MVGGMQVVSSQVSDGGTLGCFANLGNNKVLLTAGHVVFDGTGPVKEGLNVGAPDLSCCWPCTCGVIGKTLKGTVGTTLDCAIVQLNGNKTPVQRIPGLGSTITNGKSDGQNGDLILDIAPLRPDPDTGFMSPVLIKDHVRKVGSRTKLTGGKVFALNKPVPAEPDVHLPAMTSQILISPLIAETARGENGKFNFAARGDSGAVILDDRNRVAALLTRKIDLTGQGGVTPDVGFGGSGADIHAVTQFLGIDIFPSPVPGNTTKTAALVPGGRIFLHPEPTEEHARWRAAYETVREQLQQFPLGLRVLEFIDKHQPEIARLVNHTRRVTVTWHRARGPSFVARLFRGFRGLDQAIPQEVDGVSSEHVLRAMHSVLKSDGSTELAEDMDALWDVVHRTVPRSATVGELITNLREVQA
jgi:hypothetical protein